ncbi:MAG: hypothetical protein U9M89_01700 [Patescibacteria group bacterium]|nr:hypothetical protein [Patescibacteria group bacterium]
MTNKPKIQKTNSFLSWLFSGLASILLVIIMVRLPTDPDLGWHIRNGEDILKYGVPQGDLYSHTMFGYPWISHEWLTDVFLYLSEQYLGFILLGVIFAVIATASYLIAASTTKARLEIIVLTALTAGVIAMPFSGIRVQVITWLGLALVSFLLWRWYEEPKKYSLYYLIPLMLIWVNLHGGFLIGLIFVGVFFVLALIKYWLVQYKKINLIGRVLSIGQIKHVFFVLLLMLAVTFINPYTWRVYDEIIRTIFNDFVKDRIVEWLPVSLTSPLSKNLLIYTGWLMMLLPWTWRKIDPLKLGVIAIFFAFSLLSWRNLPFFPLIALPVLVEMIQNVFPQGFVTYLRQGWLLLGVGALIFYIGQLRVGELTPYMQSAEAFQSYGKYPYQAIQYIKEHKLSGNLYNEYNWGGFLVWQLPEKKVFIDGRMAVWGDPEDNVFRDYLAVSNNTSRTVNILDKYNVDLALVFDDGKAKDFFMESDVWQEIFADDIAKLFERAPTVSLQEEV